MTKTVLPKCGPYSASDVSTAVLCLRLVEALKRWHPRPCALRSDRKLLECLISLYGEGAVPVWDEHVHPFLRENDAALANLFREHRAWASVALLDVLEVPLILERLENDSLHLQEKWPFAPSLLDELASAWGAPIAPFAR